MQLHDKKLYFKADLFEEVLHTWSSGPMCSGSWVMNPCCQSFLTNVEENRVTKYYILFFHQSSIFMTKHMTSTNSPLLGGARPRACPQSVIFHEPLGCVYK